MSLSSIRSLSTRLSQRNYVIELNYEHGKEKDYVFSLLPFLPGFYCLNVFSSEEVNGFDAYASMIVCIRGYGWCIIVLWSLGQHFRIVYRIQELVGINF